MKTLIAYLLWPTLIVLCCAGTALGIAAGRELLGFNLGYAFLALSLFALERVFPFERAWLLDDGQMWPDLLHTLMSKGGVQLWVFSSAVIGVAGQAPATSWWPTDWPMWAQVLLTLVIAEFGLYWAHRLSHEWAPIWRLHAVHHSVTRLWFWNTGRFHIGNALTSIAFSAPLLWMLGAPGECLTWLSAITAFVGMLTHCNVAMRFGWLNYLFNTPELHRWHHSRVLSEGNRNYGENLMLWDQLFGTYLWPRDRRPPADIGISETMPVSFTGQLAFPFRRAR